MSGQKTPEYCPLCKANVLAFYRTGGCQFSCGTDWDSEDGLDPSRECILTAQVEALVSEACVEEIMGTKSWCLTGHGSEAEESKQNIWSILKQRRDSVWKEK